MACIQISKWGWPSRLSIPTVAFWIISFLMSSAFSLQDERPLRKHQVAGAFTYQVSRGDRVFIQGQDDALGIGDIVLQGKGQILHEQEWFPAVSLRAAVKFPSGDS